MSLNPPRNDEEVAGQRIQARLNRAARREEDIAKWNAINAMLDDPETRGIAHKLYPPSDRTAAREHKASCLRGEKRKLTKEAREVAAEHCGVEIVSDPTGGPGDFGDGSGDVIIPPLSHGPDKSEGRTKTDPEANAEWLEDQARYREADEEEADQERQRDAADWLAIRRAARRGR